MKESGLYIHIPFCKSKCMYCDFNSYSDKQQYEEAYIDNLLKELDMYQDKYSFNYKTVFIGGGTPTFINSSNIGRIMDKVSKRIKEGSEITIECNPGTVSPADMQYYRKIGINRISIGLQAWQDELLKGLGRIHLLEDFLKTYEIAVNAGFDNINADLMFALPGQTLEMWQQTLDNVCRLGVHHISCYSLKLEEGTKLHNLYEKGLYVQADDELDRKMYHKAVELLESYGYKQYEISNFSKPDCECRHNLLYWRNEDYLGIGAGSHSKIENKRFWNYRSLDRYIDSIKQGQLPIEGEDELSTQDIMWEQIFLSLRLNEGLNIEAFDREFNVDFKTKYSEAISKLTTNELIYTHDNIIRLRPKGIDLSNQVFIEFS